MALSSPIRNALLAAVLLLSACTSESTDDAARSTEQEAGIAQKTGGDERRTDLEPLTDRFPAIGEPIEVVWASGTHGELSAGGIPARSYLIDETDQLLIIAVFE